MGAISTILFDGIAYGMVLVLISIGLSLTMGLMGFANLAHGAFAMAGGYVSVTLTQHLGVPFLATLPIAFVAVAAISLVLERLLYRPLYAASELDQVLMTFGLALVSVAVTTYLAGPFAQPVSIPEFLQGQIDFGFREYPTYRTFLIVVGLVLMAGLWFGIDRTLFGARIRAAVDNRRMTQSCGINVDRLFALTFAFGSGLAALGGALGAELLPLTPSYSLEHLVVILLIVAIGGMGTMFGTFVAALLIGILDTAGKYLLPEFGGFFVYAIAVAVLLWRPAGLFGQNRAANHAPFQATGPVLTEKWRLFEILPWILAIGAFWLFDKQLAFGVSILIAILFVLSLDLVMGYTGILTLGHAAFFGMGAYVSGLLAARFAVNDPLLGLLAGAAAAALVAALSGWILLRTRGLTLLMVTVAVAELLHVSATKMSWLTGGDDGLQGILPAPIFGLFEFDFFSSTMYIYALVVLFLAFVCIRRLTQSQFGLALEGIRENAQRMASIGSAVHLRLVTVYTIAGAFAGIAGALSAQATGVVALNALSFEKSGFAVIMLVLGGLGNLYGAILGATVYMFLEHYFAKANPEYWYLWVGLFLIGKTLWLPNGLSGLAVGVAQWRRGRAEAG